MRTLAWAAYSEPKATGPAQGSYQVATTFTARTADCDIGCVDLGYRGRRQGAIGM